ncbi:hypothetical protein MTO96_048350 [Rhipicephalus appendiculatus]
MSLSGAETPITDQSNVHAPRGIRVDQIPPNCDACCNRTVPNFPPILHRSEGWRYACRDFIRVPLIRLQQPSKVKQPVKLAAWTDVLSPGGCLPRLGVAPLPFHRGIIAHG